MSGAIGGEIGLKRKLDRVGTGLIAGTAIEVMAVAADAFESPRASPDLG